MKKNILLRVIVGIFVPLFLLSGAVYLYLYKSPFVCITHELFGIYCPGCGSGRAAYQLLHLNILAAIDYNAFFVSALPFLGYELAAMYIRFVFGTNWPPSICLSKKSIIILTSAIVIFWILRNIPLFPFTILAP